MSPTSGAGIFVKPGSDGARSMLHGAYRISSFLAAAFLVAIAILIVGQIVARMFGHQIPSSDDFAAWSMAASAFLALPQTLARGEHVRVTLVLGHVPRRTAHWLAIIATSLSAAVIGWGCWHVSAFVWRSFETNELSQGLLMVPLWIPQLSMWAGMLLLFAALAERLTRLLRGEDVDASFAQQAAVE